MVVDEVSDVLNTRQDSIRTAPQFGGAVPTEFICGLVDAEGKMVMLLDVDRLLNQEREVEKNSEDAA